MNYERKEPDNYSDCGDTGIFEALVDFVGHRNHNGIYVARFDVKNPSVLRLYKRLLMGKLLIKDEQFLEKYKGRFLTEVEYDDLNRHSDKADGAIVVNGAGIVIDDHSAGRFVFPEFVSEELKTGTGHVSMGTLSRFPRITTYVCSAEKLTVRKIRHGRVVRLYDPDGYAR